MTILLTHTDNMATVVIRLLIAPRPKVVFLAAQMQVVHGWKIELVLILIQKS
jgi:hypothetical protein